MAASSSSPISRVDLISKWYPQARKSALFHAAKKRLHGDADLIEDLTQRGVWALVRAAQKFDPSRGVPFEHYGSVAIRNGVRDGLREYSRGAGVGAFNRDLNVDTLFNEDDLNPEDEAEADSMRARVRYGVDTLSEPLGHVYRLLYEEDMSQREAARALGVSQPRIAILHRKLLETGRRWFRLPRAA